jgi:hypothetical protein
VIRRERVRYPMASVAEPELKPHHFFGAGARVVTRYSSGSGPGSGSNLIVLHKLLIKNVTKCNSFLLFPFIFVTILIKTKSEEKVAPTLRLTWVCYQKVGLVYSRVEAGAASKFLLVAGAKAA